MESTVNLGQEFGQNLIKLCKKLLQNQSLCKLLVNTDLDPLNPELHSDIEDTTTLLGQNVRFMPLIDTEEQNSSSKIVVVFGDGEPTNNFQAEEITVLIYVYTPYVEWKIAGENLRPFAIMSEIRKSLQNKRINGLGEITYQGFNIASLTNQTSSYLMRFTINAFN